MKLLSEMNPSIGPNSLASLNATLPITSKTPPYTAPGMYQNGANCGRWISFTITPGDPSVPRKPNYVLVADRCSEPNCLADPYHLDQSYQGDLDQGGLESEGAKITWYFIQNPYSPKSHFKVAYADHYSFPYYVPINIGNLRNGISKVQYCVMETLTDCSQNWENAKHDPNRPGEGQRFLLSGIESATVPVHIRVFDIAGSQDANICTLKLMNPKIQPTRAPELAKCSWNNPIKAPKESHVKNNYNLSDPTRGSIRSP